MKSFTANFLIVLGLLVACTLLPARTLAGGGGGGGTTSVGQMQSWLFTSQRINFGSGGAVASTQIAAGQPNATSTAVAAAAYNNSNQLLFYVSHDFSRTVYNASNVAIGRLNGLVNPNKGLGESDWSGTGQEIAIVPVPGLCQRYYVIYALISNFTGTVGYAEIDCSGSSPVITANTRDVEPSRTDGSGSAYPYAPNAIGLAVSKQLPNGTRYLYTAGNGLVRRNTLNVGGGFSNPTVIISGAPITASRCELELSPDGTRIAVGDGGTVRLCYTSNSQAPQVTPPISFASGPASRLVGLEFSADSKKLFITGYSSAGNAGGMAVYNLPTGTQAVVGGSNFAFETQVELAANGTLYAAATNGALLAIDPNTAAVAVTALPAIGVVSNSPVTGYFFPDQIDGEDYTLSFGPYLPSLTALRVDGMAVRATAVGTVYSCTPMLFYAMPSANIVGFALTVTKTDANDTPLGTYQRSANYTALPVDLRAFDGGYLTNPANTGYYRLTLAGRNACGNTAQAIGRVWISTLTPTSVSFAFNGCTGVATPATATSVSSPAALGAFGGGGLDISNTTGDYDTYTVVFDRYNAGTYTQVGQPATIAKPTTPAGLSTVSLSYLAGNADLAPNYFQSGQPGYGQVFRLTLSVSNACGTSPALSGHFATTNTACRPVGGVATAAPAPAEALRAYPNPLPAGATGHIAFVLPSAQRVSLVLTDGLGGPAKLTVLENAALEAGSQDVAFDASRLPAGLYFYRLTTATGTVSGRLSKAE